MQKRKIMNQRGAFNMHGRKVTGYLYFLVLLIIGIYPAAADAELSQSEAMIHAAALEKSTVCEREHIVLVWPENLQVDWYPESGVRDPDQLADWLEKCYVLCVDWLKIDPNRQLNANKSGSMQARLMFIHNGMRDYNFGGKLPRPVIGLRDLRGVGSEDWFGWLTHELGHEFFLRFPEVVSTSDNNTWHEALCDYMRYWLLKESGMPLAAEHWRKILHRASRRDHYKGGADIILKYHEKMGCKSPADLWASVKGKDFSQCFGKPPWSEKRSVSIPRGYAKIEFDGMIDGAGSFTFRGSRIHYEHFTWQYPTQVKINGKPWNDLDAPFELGFTPDFASARAVDGKGRNTMALIPHRDRLVLFIDDTENAASRYRITIVVKEKK